MNARSTSGGLSVVAVMAGALLTGCGKDPAPDAAPLTDPAGVVDLVGTWETGPIPPERLRATYVEAGGSEQAATDFVAEFEAEQSVRFRIEVGNDSWELFETGDDTVPVRGWNGTYTVDGSTVRALDTGAECEIDYGAELDGDALSLAVLRHAGEGPACGAGDLLVQKTIYESAPFTRAP